MDGDFFYSWDFSFLFTEWFEEAQQRLNSKSVQAFTSLFKSVGLLQSDGWIEAVVKDFPRGQEWLVAAIPPQDVHELIQLARSINLEAMDQEFREEFTTHPSDDFPEEIPVADWSNALTEGLLAVSKRGHGLIIGAS